MTSRRKEISKELEDELRSVSFSKTVEVPSDDKVDIEEGSLLISKSETVEDEPVTKPLKKAFSLNKRVVTVEYLDKFEQATIASARYEAFQEFSHTISNLSLVLLSVSIITYLIFYFINPHTVSLISLLLLSLEAFALLGLTLYSMAKATNYKQVRDMALSDLSTTSQAIGNPRAETYIPIETPSIPKF